MHVENGEDMRGRELCLHGNPVELVERGSARKILCLFCKRLLQARQATNKAAEDKNVCVCTCASPCFIHTIVPSYCEYVCMLFCSACVYFLCMSKRRHPDRKLLLISVVGQELW